MSLRRHLGEQTLSATEVNCANDAYSFNVNARKFGFTISPPWGDFRLNMLRFLFLPLKGEVWRGHISYSIRCCQLYSGCQVSLNDKVNVMQDDILYYMFRLFLVKIQLSRLFCSFYFAVIKKYITFAMSNPRFAVLRDAR